MQHLSAQAERLVLVLTLGAVLNGCGGDTQAPATGLAALKAPTQFSFVSEVSGVLEGKSSTDPYDEHENAKDGVHEGDLLGPFAAVAQWGGKAYYTGGKYNDNDWPVAVGRLAGIQTRVEAIELSPAEGKAKNFAASKHVLFYRFDEAVDSTVYELVEGRLNPIQSLKAEEIVAGQWRRVGTFFLNNVKQKRVLAVAPSALPLSPYQPLGAGMEGSLIRKTSLGSHVQLRLKVPDAPVNSVAAFSAGPAGHANRYGQNRRFWPVLRGQEHGVVWQAPKSGACYVTWLDAQWAGASTVQLPCPDGFVLAGCTSDDQGALFLLSIEPNVGKELTTKAVRMQRLDATSSEVSVVKEVTLDAAKGGLNITSFGTVNASSNQVSIGYSDGKVGLLLARKMHKASDGLNHQGAISVVLDAETLEVLKNHGQSSGHSFESYLTALEDGRFMAVDLGDNYPRGVHLHRFTSEGRKSRVVYTFKTKHGGSAKNPAGKTFPPYEGLTSDKQLYQWSNDNSTYTEIGGVVPTESGLIVAFAGESDSLDNGKATGLHNSSRNLGVVLVRSDFEAASKGPSSAWVTDDLLLSKSDYTMEGGYYSFGGKWLKQRNTGVLWHTDYASKEDNVSRLKVSPSPEGGALLLWELWTDKAYKETFALSLDPQGAAKGAPVSLGVDFRLGRRDDPVVIGGQLASFRGDGEYIVVDLLTSK